MNNQTVLDNIRKMRLQKEIKQLDIANRLGLSESAYGKIERGETELTLNKLKSIAEILQVSPFALLDGTANYIIENSDQSPMTAFHNSSFITHNDKSIIDTLGEIAKTIPSLINTQNEIFANLLALIKENGKK